MPWTRAVIGSSSCTRTVRTMERSPWMQTGTPSCWRSKTTWGPSATNAWSRESSQQVRQLGPAAQQRLGRLRVGGQEREVLEFEAGAGRARHQGVLAQGSRALPVTSADHVLWLAAR